MTEFERVRRRLAEICLNCNHVRCTGKCARYTHQARAVLRGEDVPLDGPVLMQQDWDVGQSSAMIGRPPKLIVFRDRQYTLAELAALCTCHKRTVQRRIHDGWSIEEIYQLYSRRTRSNAGG